MSEAAGWSRLEAEARQAFAGEGRFPLPAYSEFMPSPWVGFKPFDPLRARGAATAGADDERSLDVTEYEQAHELEHGLARIATHVLTEIARLAVGSPREMSSTLLAGNPAWPKALVDAAAAGRFAREPLAIVLALALSRTQDQKGNVRWTLFGASHEGPSSPFWRSFSPRADVPDGDGGREARERFARWLAFATGTAAPSLDGVRVLAAASEVPAFARGLLLDEGQPLDGVRTIFTFRPFAAVPSPVAQAYLAGALRLVPSPGSLVFFEHPQYRKLAASLPRAMQIPLLHLFPRVEGGYGMRIPQSGWLDERHPEHRHPTAARHRLVPDVARTHRYQRGARDARLAEDVFMDRVAVALFSTDPDRLGLYGKPLARNVQIWREDYQLLLDGPRATPLEIERAAAITAQGGRFGYRFLYPPMRAGRRELWWHLPLLARLEPGATEAQLCLDDPPLGCVLAEPSPEDGEASPIALVPRLLDRPGHREAARSFPHDAGHLRYTTSFNVRKLLEFRACLGGPLAPSLARALLDVGRKTPLEEWLARLPGLATDPAAGERVVAELSAAIGKSGRHGDAVAPASGGDADRAADPGPPLTFDRTATREFEERLWRDIASLAEGDFRGQDTADTIPINRGRTGGAAAAAAHVVASHRRDLERLGDRLHALHQDAIVRHGMEGRARVVDHTFRWETEFPFEWSNGWLRNQTRQTCERNVVVMIPGRDRGEAVIMADHYDTAYMEDVYEAAKGGDGLRASAAGADDNHSATAALLAAADVLLPLAREGRLMRDVWLVHLTGEEFPADCLGARALARAIVERRLRFIAEDGALLDVSRVRPVGAFVLDMIGHNSARDRDVFQIAPGEGAGSARLARLAHLANERWNRGPGRAGLGRAVRMADGREAPPPFAHLALAGDIRAEWEPRSALYNTDGQIFSDVGIPVVLFMENYDINRSGYHDTQDTMKNIDLDYAAALAAIAIETVADTACSPSP